MLQLLVLILNRCSDDNFAWVLDSCVACRRKAAELAGSNKGKSKLKSGNAPPAAIIPGSSSAAVSAPPAAPVATDAAKFQKVPKANKPKKGKASKGQKVDTSLLGFQNKMDFTVLQRGDDFA